MGIFDALIAQPLGYIIKGIYDLTKNYGVAIILFTLITRIILLPLSIKQQKSAAKTQKIAPVISDIQKKYKNDKEKLNQEMMRVYKKYNINPMGGCLPLIVQLPILIGLIQVIYKPVRFVLGMDVNEVLSQFPDVTPTGLVQIELAKRLGAINFDFLGIDLSAIPDYTVVSVLWIIPLLAAAATYFSGKVTPMGAKSGDGDGQAQQMSRSMTTIFPIMTLFFTFTMPVAASLYWFVSSVLQTGQQYILNKTIKVDDIIVEEGRKKR